jgi:hypothetical protein
VFCSHDGPVQGCGVHPLDSALSCETGSLPHMVLPGSPPSLGSSVKEEESWAQWCHHQKACPRGTPECDPRAFAGIGRVELSGGDHVGLEWALNSMTLSLWDGVHRGWSDLSANQGMPGWAAERGWRRSSLTGHKELTLLP